MPLGFAKIGLTGGLAEAPYQGTNVSADLLWHLKKIPVSSYSSGIDVTTANGYASDGINVGGTTYGAKVIAYNGNQTFGSGNIGANTNDLCLVRIEGDLTIDSGFDLTTSTACRGMYMYIDGDLTVNGSITMYNKGTYISSGISTTLAVNSSSNEVAGSTVITMSGSASQTTNGSSTASGLQTGGGGKGGYGSYGQGSGASGHIFQEAQVVEVEVALPTITTTQVEVEQVELPLPMQEQVEVVEPQDILNGATTQQMQVEQVAQEMVEVEVELTTPIIPTTLEVDIQETQEQVVH